MRTMHTGSVAFWSHLLDALMLEACVVDGTGTIVMVNEAWRAFARDHGGLSAATQEGANYLAACDHARGPRDEGADAVAANLRAILAGGSRYFELEYPSPAPDDGERWFLCQIAPLEIDGQRFAVVTHLDISRRHAAEDASRNQSRELQSTIGQLHEADRMKQRFISSVSHELRTPLTTIMGFAELLEDLAPGHLVPEQQVALAHIVQASIRIERLVTDLLEYARLEGGTFRLWPGPVDLRTKIAEIVDSMRPMAQETGVRIVQDPMPPMDGLMDGTRIGQVLSNLLSNALKFSPRDGEIRVSGRTTNGDLLVEITDHGEGISEEDLPKLFLPFSQLEHGARAGKGMGLGLSISKSLIEAHRGVLGVRSLPGQGSTFWFTLPRAGPTSRPD